MAPHTPPAPPQLPHWRWAPLTPPQLARHRAQLAAMRRGTVARFPQGLRR